MPSYKYTLGDVVVVRHEATNSQRMGKIVDVRENGAGHVQLPADKKYPRDSFILVQTNGISLMGAFTVIKHVPYADYVATGRC